MGGDNKVERAVQKRHNPESLDGIEIESYGDRLSWSQCFVLSP